MSEGKKVIHVKNLIIKADHVHIEPSRRRQPAFFEPRKRVDDRKRKGEKVKRHQRIDPLFGRPFLDERVRTTKEETKSEKED